jgi:hypothetical protein
MDWVRSQFDTRTIVLIPIAIAINIVLGQTVYAVLKIPVYLDSIGTVLVGALAGPIPGLLTGALTNLLWTYVMPAPFNSPTAAPYFIVAAEIGLLAGLFSRYGFFRSRPNTPWPTLIAGGVAVAAIFLIVGVFGFVPFYAGQDFVFFGDLSAASPFFTVMGYAIAIGFIAAVIGLAVVLLVRRDVGIAYASVAGFITGIVSALISAPIYAYLQGGVSGSATDILVAAFQQAGSDLMTAVLQQGLISDPIDKTVTFILVFLILQVLSRRFVARFPQGERIVGLEGAEDDVAGIPAT